MAVYITGLNLQLFAEGGDGGAGAAPGGTAGAEAGAANSGENTPVAGVKTRTRKPDPFANVQYGQAAEKEPEPKTTQPEPKAEPQRASFDELIKGDYKADFDARVQEIIGKRFKSQNADRERLAKTDPILDLLGEKYGLEKKDGAWNLEDLEKALSEDDDMYAEQAAKRGMSVDTYKLVSRLERQEKARQAQEEANIQERQNRARFEQLVRQSEEAKKVYPGLDLNAEMQNPAFARLVANNVDAKTAYEVTHKDEIMRSGMQFAAQTAAQKVSNSVAANQKRPQESGMGNSAPSTVRITDPRLLTKEQRKDLRQRVRRGEKIVW